MNEIKTEIQNFVHEKEYERAGYYSFNLTDWLSDHGNIPAEEWETWWFAERNPPNDNGLYNFSTQCISAETHPEFDALGKSLCFWPFMSGFIGLGIFDDDGPRTSGPTEL